MHANLLAAVGSATASFHTPHINYLSILPILIMMGGAIVLMGVSSLLRKIFGVGVGTWGTVAVSVAALAAAIVQWHDVTMLLTALIGDGYLRREGIEGCEFHVLAMLSASGAMLMGSANDLIVVFLGLEILSIALYVLAAFNHKRAESGEAALKYFVLGAFSSAIFVYGIALAYGATGTTNLPQIASYLSKNVVASNGVLLAGLALLLVGFGFKIAAVPFHMWSPDVYQGAPSPITGFMAAVAKAGAFAALLRVFVSSFGVVRTDWQPIVWGLAILSLVVGAVLALVQRDVKRMMAYSSINHAGFILLGVQAADARGVSASLYYLFAYMFMVIGTFAVITVIGRVGDTGHQLSDYRGLARRQPALAGAFAVFLLAQAGIPFTTGFLAKFQVVAAAVDVHSYALAVLAMVSAAIAAFFYLRVAVTMYSPVGPVGDPIPGEVGGAPATSLAAAAGPPAGAAEALGRPAGVPGVSEERPGLEHRPGEAERTSLALMTEAPANADVAGRVVRVPALTWVAISLCGAFTVVFGIIPEPIIDFAHQATLLFVG